MVDIYPLLFMICYLKKKKSKHILSKEVIWGRRGKWDIPGRKTQSEPRRHGGVGLLRRGRSPWGDRGLAGAAQWEGLGLPPPTEKAH